MEISKLKKITMPWKRWKMLSDASKNVWDTLPDHDKAIIFGYRHRSAEASRGVISNEVLGEEDEAFHDAEHPDASDGTEQPTIEINQSQQQIDFHSQVLPHNIRSILSQKNKSKPRRPTWLASFTGFLPHVSVQYPPY